MARSDKNFLGFSLIEIIFLFLLILATPKRSGLVTLCKTTLAPFLSFVFLISLLVKFAKQLKPSKRGEIEIVDLLNIYRLKKQLTADLIGRGGAWLDTGSIEDFYKTSAFVSAIENRQGFKIACLEEISLNKKWISKKEINASTKFYGNCEYSNYLRKLIS